MKTVMIILLSTSISLITFQTIHAKANKGISIKTTFAKGTCEVMGNKKYDKNQDGYLSQSEIKQLKNLYLCSYSNLDMQQDINIKGISKLKYLEKLEIDGDGDIYNAKEIKRLYKLQDVIIRMYPKKKRVFDFRRIKGINSLYIFTTKGKAYVSKNNSICKLHVDGVENGGDLIQRCVKAQYIFVSGSKKKTKVDVKNRKKLKRLKITDSKNINRYNIRNCKNLSKMELSEVEIVDEFKVTRCNKLSRVEVFDGKIKEVKIENCPRIEKILFSEIKKLSSVTINRLSKLKSITIEFTPQLRSVTLNNLNNLKYVRCSHGKLSELNIIGKNKIREMDLYENKLKTFQYDNLKGLVELNISNNDLEGKFDFSLYPYMYILDCENNKLTEIYGGAANREIVWIGCRNNQIKLIDFRGTTNGCILAMDCKKNPNIVVYAVVEDFMHDASATLHENI